MGWLFVIFVLVIPLWRLFNLRKSLPSSRWTRYRGWRETKVESSLFRLWR